MTEFEKSMLSFMQEMKSNINGLQEQMQEMKGEINGINNRLDGIDNRLDKIEADIEEIKENAEITRAATNYNGERMEELIAELQKSNIIA